MHEEPAPRPEPGAQPRPIPRLLEDDPDWAPEALRRQREALAEIDASWTQP